MSIFAQVIGGPASPSYDGGTLTSDLHVGDLVLHVDDTADFDEDAGVNGGALILNVDLNTDGTVNTATGTVMAYVACSDTASTVTLAAASTVAAVAGDRVFIQNPTTGQPVGDTQLMVQLNDADTTGDALMVSLDMSLLGGLTYPDLTNHAIELDEDEDGQLVVRNLPGLAQTVPTYLPSVGTTITGATFQTNIPPANRIVMRDDGSEGILEFFSGAAGEVPGSINPNVSGTFGHQIVFKTSSVAGAHTSIPGSMALSSGGAGIHPQLYLGGNTDIWADGGLIFTSKATMYPNGNIFNDNLQLLNTGDVKTLTATMNLTTSNANLQVGGASLINGKIGNGAVQACFAPNALVIANATYNNTLPTSSANMQTLHAADMHAWTGFYSEDLSGGGTTTASVRNDGRVIRTASSARYKDDIEPLDVEESRKVLDLEPVMFRYKEEGPDGRLYPGFTAEQVEEAGASLWVNYDEQGRPDGVRYAELTAPLVLLVRDLYDRLDALTARVAELEAERGT